LKNIKPLVAIITAALLFITACSEDAPKDSSSEGSSTDSFSPAQPVSIAEISNPDLANSKLRNLLGTVNFLYTHENSMIENQHQVFFDESSFDPEFLSISGFEAWLVNTSLFSATACAAPTIGGYEFLCFHFLGSPDNILSELTLAFDLSSSTAGDGVFEYCTSAERPCASEIHTTPDGKLTVSIDSILIRFILASGGASVCFCAIKNE